MLFSYLALGDSYTIGEQVPIYESFPYQAIQLMRKKDPANEWLAPEILAKTGWTTDELLGAMEQWTFRNRYDIVSLLVGVNNQYRGRPVIAFEVDFQVLLQKAIALAGDAGKVFVLSIPDWGVTPFAAERDQASIAREINKFNEICRNAAVYSGCPFIDITASQRVDAANPEFLAPDGLHPSGKEYEKWAVKLTELL